MNKTKGIVRNVVEELSDIVKETGKEVKKQVAEGAKKTAITIIGAEKAESSQNVSDLVLKEENERKKKIAYFQRIIREEKEAGKRVQGARELENKETQEEEVKPEKIKGIIKPPGSIRQRPGIGLTKAAKKGPEIRDIKSG